MNTRTLTRVARLCAVAVTVVALTGCAATDVGVDLTEIPASGDETFEAPARATDDPGVVSVGIGAYGNCGGYPLMGTRYVITATHCVTVQTSKGRVVKELQIAQDGEVIADATHVLLDVRYFVDTDAAYDVAVIETDTYFNFGANGFAPLPSTGSWSAYGLQRVGLDGVRLAADEIGPAVCEVYDCSAEPEVRRHQDRIARFERHVTAGCTGDIAGVEHRRDDAFNVDCGMVPGASGGPVVVRTDNGRILLVGVVSTVNSALTYNGIAPAIRLEDLLGGADFVLRVDVDPRAASEAYVESGYMDAAERMAKNRARETELDALREQG
jgi:hypothetical protein